MARGKKGEEGAGSRQSEGKWAGELGSGEGRYSQDGVRIEKFQITYARAHLKKNLRAAIETVETKNIRTAKVANKWIQRAVECVEYLDDIERGFEKELARKSAKGGKRKK